VVLAAALSLTGCTPVLLNINSTIDDHDTSIDGVCDDGAGHCTLRAALEEANAVAGLGPAFSVPAGTYALTLGQIPITRSDDITVKRESAVVVTVGLSANGDRCVDVASGSYLDLTGFRISGGSASDDGGSANVSGDSRAHSFFIAPRCRPTARPGTAVRSPSTGLGS